MKRVNPYLGHLQNFASIPNTVHVSTLHASSTLIQNAECHEITLYITWTRSPTENLQNMTSSASFSSFAISSSTFIPYPPDSAREKIVFEVSLQSNQCSIDRQIHVDESVEPFKDYAVFRESGCNYYGYRCCCLHCIRGGMCISAGHLVHLTHPFTAQMSSRLMQTEMLRSRVGPVELFNDQSNAFALGGAPVRRVTTTNVVKVQHHHRIVSDN